MITGAYRVWFNGTDVTPYVRDISLSTPITSYYRPDGSLKEIRVDYEAMSSTEREDIVAWIKAHNLDPGRVSIHAVIGYYPSTDEWSFPVFVRGPKGRGIRVDLATGDLMTRVVRRRRTAAILLSTIRAL